MHLLVFSISGFPILVAKSINIPGFSINSAILILSSISALKINKLNSFRAPTASCPLTFLSNLSNREKVALVANLTKTCLAKVTARSNK